LSAKKLKNCFVAGRRAILSSLGTADHLVEDLTVSWSCGPAMHWQSDCDCDYDCSCGFDCGCGNLQFVQIVTMRYFL
jgi:hypothetical protein